MLGIGTEDVEEGDPKHGGSRGNGRAQARLSELMPTSSDRH